MSDTIPGMRPTRQGAEEVRSEKRTWTLQERQWVEYVLKKLSQYSSWHADSHNADKILKLGGLLKACGLEMLEDDPAVGCEPLKVKLADTSGPGTESGVPEIQREGGPTLTQRDGPATEPAKTDQQRWDASMARAEALQDRSEQAFEREQKLITRIENLVEQADLFLARLIARQSGAPTEADIKRTQELNRERGWEENKATVGTIPTEQPGNPLIPSGSTSSFPKLKREFAQGGLSEVRPEPVVRLTGNPADIYKVPTIEPGSPLAKEMMEQLRRSEQAAHGTAALETASQRIQQLEQANEEQAKVIEYLRSSLADAKEVNQKRRRLGDRFIELAKDLEKWRNE